MVQRWCSDEYVQRFRVQQNLLCRCRAGAKVQVQRWYRVGTDVQVQTRCRGAGVHQKK